jgi:hypothetical protein
MEDIFVRFADGTECVIPNVLYYQRDVEGSCWVICVCGRDNDNFIVKINDYLVTMIGSRNLLNSIIWRSN